MFLSDLETGDSAVIIKVLGHGGFRRRILEMGFVRGQNVLSVLNAPLRDPIKYKIMGYEVSLRRSEAAMVEVITTAEAEALLSQDYADGDGHGRGHWHLKSSENCNGEISMSAHDRKLRESLLRSSNIQFDDNVAASDSGKNAGWSGGQSGNQDHRNAYEHSIGRGINHIIRQKMREINVALIGNPNSGKTSLFNALSGGREHVGNYSGVTVDAKSGSFRYKGYKINITDLPGTYALSAYTPEELYVRRHLVEKLPDVVINAVVASNMERNLYLTTELIDINPKMVVALNMYDELEQSGAKLDYEQLGRMIGIPMVPVVARDHKGLHRLIDEVILTFENENPKVRHIHINYSSSIETEIASLSRMMKENIEDLPKCFPPRYWAIKMLEGDKSVTEMLASSPHFDRWHSQSLKGAARIKAALDEDVESAITNEKYGFIEGALAETYTPSDRDPNRKTSFVDRIVTNKYLGFPLFLLVMFVMFWSTFTLGAYPQQWIESAFTWLGSVVGGAMSEGPLRDLIVDGIIGGVGAVAVFLPNILILYLFISLMEDSGYMARAAFIMDRIMHLAGLHGKSFIPLVMGFGCNVPAIMASRTIESRSSRLITILINPFMSCSARLPVFILLTGTFFPEHAGVMLFGIYIFGAVAAVVTARILRRFMFGADETPFVMELPPYRVPTLNATLRHIWERCEQYLKKIGGLILVAAVIIWFLSYYPHNDANRVVANDVSTTEFVADGGSTATDNGEKMSIPSEDVTEQIGDGSYLERIGRFCEPVMRPLGLDWKASVAMLSGTAAKEIIVSTLGVLYSADEGEHISDNSKPKSAENASNGNSLATKLYASGDYTPASALSMMLFILLYFPCIATVAAIAHEAGSWRWAAFSIVYNTSLAWIVAFTAYRLAIMFGL